MIRWLGWIFGGLLLGGVVHLATILWMPAAATRDSFTRLSLFTNPNRTTLLPQPSPTEPLLPFTDPAFATAVCRYDLSAGALKVRMPVTPAYGSLTFYTRDGIAFYAINDRAGRRVVELDLMTAQQRSQIQEDEEVTAADRLIVQTPTTTGLIVLRAFATEPSALPIVRGILSVAECSLEPPK